LDLRPDRPIVSLFTNVMWDAQLYHACNAFPNMLDWVFETIEYFARRPELQLVIRIHPAEVKATKKTEQPVAEEIRQRFPTLPAHIRVVGPESDVSSYDLAEASAAAIIFGTKMGLEIALRRVPVIVAGESFVRGKGFTYDASSRQDYFACLDRLPDLPRLDDGQFERAQRYGYHFYYRRQMDFPFIEEGTEKTVKRLNLQDVAALGPGRNPTLDRICDGLIHGTEFVAP